MGCSQSKPGLLADTADGDGKDFLERYNIDRIVGRGEFGVVKLVFDAQLDPNSTRPIACKILRKGMQFKDNTLYSPIKPHVLQSECGILQTLGGKHHTLKLIGIYESPSTIYILTEYLEGGDMFQYVSRYYGDTSTDGTNTDGNGNTNASGGDEVAEGLRTEDVSRMAFELLDAVNHCAKHGIIHRDIKPENVMFKKGERRSSLKLIDFGAGTFCAETHGGGGGPGGGIPFSTQQQIDAAASNSNIKKVDDGVPEKIKTASGEDLHLHTTFAGSAFYISPEMFRNHYTVLTDIWSVGVTLYVLVAGYPADALQEAFNKLHSNKRTIDQLKNLPNMPNNMPDTYYEMLDSCLTYKHRLRKGAGDILDSCEFVNFHKEHYVEEEDDDNEDEDGNVISLNEVLLDASKRTRSFLIEGSVTRHTTMLLYTQFERAVTSLLASVLIKSDLKALLDEIDVVIDSNEADGVDGTEEKKTNRKRLQIIKIGKLRDILKILKFDDVLPTIDELAHGKNYNKFAYHVAFLRQFYTLGQDHDVKGKNKNSDLDNSTSRKLRIAMARHDAKNPKGSNHGTEPNLSEYGDEENNDKKQGRERIMNSIHNGNAWDTISKKIKIKQPRRDSF
mmetsp:Transcript_12649/g.19156  ORF Transcript_12649/g.19156 Transcript_12649/m.19156 type:complete len:617 (-) Transcript_12649:97-1947(-)|eukprot:CAMPEP_0203675282 /NCGR_PEP_ID=MMETSP0090-20130426/19762_1 /ASSEMBLY_ACC=CAM_ASM_001088 /TAXON_ID=426623 /ORGANISM="Chaetoceros affinis, Strain CCMP159" /LENGTH=616 /DNA_ID=CAMNT_0050541433 /DNA_START=175 /DNA_END=2025 /DNA_ORIENTATION=+